MTDQNDSSDTGTAPTEGAAEGAQPVVHCHAQYLKDMSFENPHALEAVAAGEAAAPNVDMNVQISAQPVRDGLFEVVVTVEGKAVRADKHLFVVEVQYAGLFTIQNIPREHLEPVLYIHCPMLLFPFARQIVAEVTRNGGYPPLLLNPVDFAQLYQAQSVQRASGNGGANGGGQGSGNGNATA